MPMPSANGISIMDKEHSSPTTKKSIDELKRQVTKLKVELESERFKLKEVHREKTSELKRVQENYEKERYKTIETVTKRLKNEHSVELRRQRESLIKEKDNELRQVLKFKDEELKAFKQQILEEKDRAKRAEDDFKRLLAEKSKGSSNDTENRLREELSDQKEQKRKIDELYRLKCAADFEKAELIRRLKSEHEREVSEIIRQSKREIAKEYQHLRSAEKALEEKNHELSFKDQLTRKLEVENEEIRLRNISGDINVSESLLRSPKDSGLASGDFQRANKDKERELRKNIAELQSKLDGLEKKCSLFKKEKDCRQAECQKTSGLVEEKVKKLKKRNSELVYIARQLEEKAKNLQEEKNAILKQVDNKDDPSAEVEHMKRLFARQRAKDLAEHARNHLEKDNELKILRKEVASHEQSSGKFKAQNDKIEELQAIIKKTAKERLSLEKKLVSVGYPSPSPLPPAPTGEHDLEKRLETYTNETNISEKEAERLKKELESKIKECNHLKQYTEEMKVKSSKLELEREKFAVKCTMLHQKNVELGKKVAEVKKLEEEIKCLQKNLQKVKDDKQLAEQECLKLKDKLEELMHVKEDLKTSEKQRKNLEVLHKSSICKLSEREEEIKQLHRIQEESTRAHHLAVTTLEQDLRKLEQKCADSDLRATNIKNELENMKSRRSSEHKATQTSSTSMLMPKEKMVTGAPYKMIRRDILEQQRRKEKVCDDEIKDTDILNTAGSRIKQLAMSDSEEDSYSVDFRKVDGCTDEDDIAMLSRRINQAELSDTSSVSAVNNEYDSDASRDVNSMAEGDMGDMEDNDGIDVNSKETLDERYLQQERSLYEEEAENLSVYIARYSYDPYQHSPNDNPEAELAFRAGDYLYVFGDIDDDGFFLGELMDGQRGLVPSNFVEKIADESDITWTTNDADQQAEYMSSSDDEESLCRLHRNLRLNVEHIPDSNLGDIEEEEHVTTETSREELHDSHDGLISEDTDLEASAIASPQQLVLSRQFTRSALLNWKPANLPIDEIEGYTVFVNGQLKVVIKGGHNTKALIEDIDPNETYRVSVRTVTKGGDESLDQEAMLTIGKGLPDPPLDVHLVSTSSRTGPNSLEVSWIPVTITEQGKSNGAPVTGYKVYINDVAVAEVTSPTVDCVTVAPWMIERAAKKSNGETLRLVVRTQSSRGESVSSNCLCIPATSFNFDMNKLIRMQPTGVKPKGHSNDSRQIDSENEQEYQDDNHNSISKESDIQYHTNSVVSDDSYAGVDTSNVDKRTPPVPKPRTRGKPVVWKMEVSEEDTTSDSGDSNKGEHGGSSNNEEDEQVEICNIYHLEDQKARPGGKDGSSLLEQQQIQQIQQLQQKQQKQEQKQQLQQKQQKQEQKQQLQQKQQKQEQKQQLQQQQQQQQQQEQKQQQQQQQEQKQQQQQQQEQEQKQQQQQQQQQEQKQQQQQQQRQQKQQQQQQEEEKQQQQKQEENQQQQQQELQQQQQVQQQPQQQQLQDREQPNKEEDNKEHGYQTKRDLSQNNERKLSVNDIDLVELNDALSSATSFKRDKKMNKETREPFICPLDVSDSEIGDSNDEEVLSVIDEIEEMEEAENEEKDSGNGVTTKEGKNMPEPAQERSHSSHSTLDGFQSDDDVMDLLEEETEYNQERNMTVTNVRQIPQETKYIQDKNAPTSLQKNILTSTELVEADQGDPNRTLSYNDAEADHCELLQPNDTSTPRKDKSEASQQEHTLREESYESDTTEGNRTYTVSETKEISGEDQEEEEEEQVRIFIALYDYDPNTMSPNPGADEDELTFNEGDLIKIYGDKDEDGFYWGELDDMAGFVPYNMVSEVQVDEEDLLDESTASLADNHSSLYTTNNVPGLYKTPFNEYQQNEIPDNKYLQNKAHDDQYQEPEGHSSQYPKVVVSHPASDSGYDQEDNMEDQPEDMETMSAVEEEEVGYEDPRNSVNYSLKPKKMIALFDYDPQKLSPNPDSEVELRFRSGEIIYVYGDMDEDGFYTGEQGGVRGLVPSNFLQAFTAKTEPPSHEQENSLNFPKSRESSFQETPAPGPHKTSTPNGIEPAKNDSPKKKKGLLSKGKQMLKKMTKSPQTPKR